MPTLRVPAVSANLGAGFDSFGLALALYNYVTFTPSDDFSLQIIGEGQGRFAATRHNMLVKAAQLLYDEVGAGQLNLQITMHNHIPSSRGLGSSAAAVVGGLKIANLSLAEPLDDLALLQLANRIEGHPDNAAAAIYGGFVVAVQDNGRVYPYRVDPPDGLKAVAAVPEFSLSTSKSRQSLPEGVSIKDAAYNLSHASLLALAMARGDLDAMTVALNDRLHQTQRLKQIPGGDSVIKAAKDAGAIGAVLSGSGSTILALTDGLAAKQIGGAMRDAFKAAGIKAKYLLLSLDLTGAQVIANTEEEL